MAQVYFIYCLSLIFFPHLFLIFCFSDPSAKKCASLVESSKEGHFLVASALLEAGALPNLAIEDGLYAIHFACEKVFLFFKFIFLLFIILIFSTIFLNTNIVSGSHKCGEEIVGCWRNGQFSFSPISYVKKSEIHK